MEIITVEAIESAKEALEPLADLVGVGATELWAIMVRQQYIHGSVTLFVALILAGFAVWGASSLRGMRRRKVAALACAKDQYEVSKVTLEHDERFALTCMGTVATAVFVGILVIVSARYLLNPHYYAIRDTLLLVRSVIGG